MPVELVFSLQMIVLPLAVALFGAWLGSRFRTRKARRGEAHPAD